MGGQTPQIDAKASKIDLQASKIGPQGSPNRPPDHKTDPRGSKKQTKTHIQPKSNPRISKIDLNAFEINQDPTSNQEPITKRQETISNTQETINKQQNLGFPFVCLPRRCTERSFLLSIVSNSHHFQQSWGTLARMPRFSMVCRGL